MLLSFSYYFFIDFFNKYLVLRSFDLKQYLSVESIIFSFVWIFIISIALYISKNIVRKIFLISINLILFILFSIINYFMNSYFGSVFSWKDLILSGEGLGFINSVFKYINYKLIVFIIICVILNVLILKLSNQYTYKLKSFQTLIIGILVITSIITYNLNLNKLSKIVDGWDANSALSAKSNYYMNWINPNQLILIGGTYDYMFRDFYESFLKKENIGNSKKVVEQYIEDYKETSSENYKGRFKGKNLIFIMLESMDDWMINEETTPTMWYMMQHGFNFNNHYSPVYVTGSTANTEFIANTGIYPNINKLSPNYAYNKNSYAYSLANLFKSEDYEVNSFHRSFGHIYNRVQMHESFGYKKYHNYLDMGISDADYNLDSYIIKNAYDKIVLDGKFMSFIITYSPHSPYEKSKIECQKNLEDIEKLYPSLNEEEICALSSARETDNMFKLLLENLKEDNKLEDTVIVAFSDHPNNVKLNEGESEKLNKTAFFIYSDDMKNHQINDISSTINILPTIKNLFDLKGEFVYPGCDLLNCEDNYIIFNDFTYFDGENVSEITEKQKLDIDYSKNLLISDYYKK
mgnify:CR=1 FL=1